MKECTTMDRFDKDKNRDAVDRTTGGHPIGTGVGAVAGGVAGGMAGAAATGAAAGTVVGGPVGTAIGAVVGAVAGGLLGRGVAEMIDPAAEDAYWRDNYSSRPYISSGASYDDYGPAYRYGVDAATKYPGRSFDEVDAELGTNWPSTRGSSRLEWDRAKHAARDSWQRVSDTIERAVPGDSDRDGK
jgi:hypothetical protein